MASVVFFSSGKQTFHNGGPPKQSQDREFGKSFYRNKNYSNSKLTLHRVAQRFGLVIVLEISRDVSLCAGSRSRARTSNIVVFFVRRRGRTEFCSAILRPSVGIGVVDVQSARGVALCLRMTSLWKLSRGVRETYAESLCAETCIESLDRTCADKCTENLYKQTCIEELAHR